MIPQVEQIAARVRELREILDIPVADIARDIGVDADVYQKYESGEDDIPVGKLYLIASVLHVDPTVLLIGDSPRMVDYTIVRGGRGIDVERYAGYRFSSLAYNYINREMEPMIVTLDPSIVRPELVTHEGQEFNYVLEGNVAVILRDKEYILRAGDSMYFNPAIPHGQRAVGDTPAKFLTIINERM
ncbi:MAG: XRE family transcriptional regulator [Eubacteriales bacterium]